MNVIFVGGIFCHQSGSQLTHDANSEVQRKLHKLQRESSSANYHPQNNLSLNHNIITGANWLT